MGKCPGLPKYFSKGRIVDSNSFSPGVFIILLYDSIFKAKAVGVDVEWQPTFGSQTARAALLQIATHDNIFLIDMYSLREIEKITLDQCRHLMKQVFENPHILKLGFGMKEDLQVLSRSFLGLHDVSKSIKNYVDLRTLWSALQIEHSPLFPLQGKLI